MLGARLTELSARWHFGGICGSPSLPKKNLRYPHDNWEEIGPLVFMTETGWVGNPTTIVILNFQNTFLSWRVGFPWHLNTGYMHQGTPPARSGRGQKVPFGSRDHQKCLSTQGSPLKMVSRQPLPKSQSLPSENTWSQLPTGDSWVPCFPLLQCEWEFLSFPQLDTVSNC